MRQFLTIDPTSGSGVQVEVFPDGGRPHALVQFDVGPTVNPVQSNPVQSEIGPASSVRRG